ncbi:hypothetical protein GURKE_00070 [Brevundimonas phage vB_BpoS-Gurke]|uniref:Uncharacterized protein n=1 Tax=Brevundimonas phage vB_BpoS-Gurke TaxID=2948599 RepID=A0A9E7SSK9_9CAUD|nr:hypothetical protein GURKE_00070 [Brevundimonas phage vB_BpoS-Gurke]
MPGCAGASFGRITDVNLPDGIDDTDPMPLQDFCLYIASPETPETIAQALYGVGADDFYVDPAMRIDFTLTDESFEKAVIRALQWLSRSEVELTIQSIINLG